MATILTNKTVVTRKPHKCWGCAEIYEKGSTMRYNTYADEGSMHSAYWCETCDHIIKNWYNHWDLEDGIKEGSIKSNDIGFWESTKRCDINKKHESVE